MSRLEAKNLNNRDNVAMKNKKLNSGLFVLILLLLCGSVTEAGACMMPPPDVALVSPNKGTTCLPYEDGVLLQWTGSYVSSFDVYLNGVKILDDTPGLCCYVSLSAGTFYSWYVVAFGLDGSHVTSGVGTFATASSARAVNPSPATGAIDIAIITDLSWIAAEGAVSHDVYFGTVSPGTFQGNQASNTFDPGMMSNNTTYYWRIDEVTDCGDTITGTVWSFTTIVGPPGVATAPSPANGATNVTIDTDLSWTAGSGATSHNVYFGTVSPGTLQGNQTSTTFDPGVLAYDTTYYWRIDEVNAYDTTTGTIWSFTTMDGTPDAATILNPADGAVDIAVDTDLSWTEGLRAASHDVYFGTVSPGTFQGNQAGTTFDPGVLVCGTTYYWRIDEVNTYGTTTGALWSFTTVPLPPAQATNPAPALYASLVGVNADLSWTAGTGATSHNVYFGSGSAQLVFQGNQAGTTFDPGLLDPDTIYYWRIDEVNAGGTTTGTVWGFTTVLMIFVDADAEAGGNGSSLYPYNGVQDALYAAIEDGFIVIKGIFHENINFNGKNVTLVSHDLYDPAVVTAAVIQGDGTGPVVTFAGTQNSTTLLKGITITSSGGNVAGIEANGSTAKIAQCIIKDNAGGGIRNCNGSISNCIISGNSADYGSALYNCDGSITNCTVVGNTAGTSLNGGLLDGCDGAVTNCIIWGNRPNTSYNAAFTITYSCFPAGSSGTGNIPYYPYFIDIDGGDYHLKSYSPCIDAGDSSPYSNEPGGGGGRINMGAYGNTPGAALACSDSDSDGIPDEWELLFYSDEEDCISTDDVDAGGADGLDNLAEYHYGANPLDSDSDDDGLLDGEEVNTYSTNPTNPDTDGDNLDDGWEVDNDYDPTTYTNLVPVAVDNTNVVVDEDTPVNITLDATDSNNNTLVYHIYESPDHGELSGTMPDVIYTPEADYNGTDSFRFWVHDGTEASNIATVSITINSIADNPIALDDSITVMEDESVEINLAGTDADGDSITYAIVTSPTSGTLTPIDGDNGIYQYSPSANFNGDDSFTFKVNDGSQDSANATVSITVIAVPETRYVNNAVSGGSNNGTSWTNAFNNLTSALVVAEPDDEVWVAAGSGAYTPAGGRSASFQIGDGVAVYGGFAGNEIHRSEQDWLNNVTILSGDIGVAGNPADNCYHVVNLGIGTANSTIDGFIITAGNADYIDYNSLGGGLLSQADNVKIRNCSFIGNSADYGGGLFYGVAGNAELINCLFSGNHSDIDGAGVYNSLVSPSIVGCTFSNNQATGNGGAIYNYGASPAIINCIIWGNTAASGGSVYNNGTSQPYISYSDVAGCGGSGANWVTAIGIDGGNNIDANPLFTDADGDDLSLSTGSQCIGTGIAGENMGVNIPVDATAVVNPVAVTDPVDLAIDSDGQLYVLSSSQHQVLIYNDQLVWQSTITTISATNPKGLFVDGSKNIYIADTGGDRILKYLYSGGNYNALDTTFSTDGIVGTSGSGDGQFNQPWGIGLDWDGNVYVSDSGNNRVQVFDSSGQFIRKWGIAGIDDAQFNTPKGICMPNSSNIWIADSANHRIQNISLYSGSFNSKVGMYGSLAAQFDSPCDISYDLNSDQLIVADKNNNRIQIFQLNSTGEYHDDSITFIKDVSSQGYSSPSSVACTSNGHSQMLYIADTGNNRIVKVEVKYDSPINSPTYVWENLKNSLQLGDIAGSLELFSDNSRDVYSHIFSLIEANLQDLAAGMGTLTLDSYTQGKAKYEMQYIDGTNTYSFPVIFTKDADGVWKIFRF